MPDTNTTDTRPEATNDVDLPSFSADGAAMTPVLRSTPKPASEPAEKG